MIDYEGKKIKTDPYGYLLQPQDWSEGLAEQVARQENILLTQEHWHIIYFVRDFYQRYNTSPAMRALTKSLAQTSGVAKGNSRYLHKLFPCSPAKLICKIAGLPKPVRCI